MASSGDASRFCCTLNTSATGIDQRFRAASGALLADTPEDSRLLHDSDVVVRAGRRAAHAPGDLGDRLGLAIDEQVQDLETKGRGEGLFLFRGTEDEEPWPFGTCRS